MKNTLIYILAILLSFGCSSRNKKPPENTRVDTEVLMLDSIATLYHSGDFDNCIRLGIKFTIDYPNNDRGWHLLSSSYLAKGRDSIAEVYADKALQIDSSNHIALTNKGILLDKKKKYDEAVVFYKKSLKINNRLAQTYSNYMVNRIRDADYAYAVDLGEKALKYENNIWDKANLCFAYHKIGKITRRDSLLKELKDIGFEKLESLEETMFGNSE